MFNSSGNKDVAWPLFQDAYELALRIKDDGNAVDAAHMMAIVEQGDKSLQWNLKALDLAEQSTDEKARKWKGSLYNNIGWTYFDRQKFEEAHLMFEEALKCREQEGDITKILIARWCLGKVLRMMQHTEEALEIQRDLFEQWRAMGKESGYVYEETAECLLALGQEQESRDWFAAAYKELVKDPRVANDQERISRLKELGGLSQPRMQENQDTAPRY